MHIVAKTFEIKYLEQNAPISIMKNYKKKSENISNKNEKKNESMRKNIHNNLNQVKNYHRD